MSTQNDIDPKLLEAIERFRPPVEFVSWTKGPPETWQDGDALLVLPDHKHAEPEVLTIDEDGSLKDRNSDNTDLKFSDIAWYIPVHQLQAAIPKD